MMDNISFAPDAWVDFQYWLTVDKKTQKKLLELLKDIQRDYYHGIGKPEPLKGMDGCWSRRIDEKNRLVYRIDDGDVVVLSCRGHYRDK